MATEAPETIIQRLTQGGEAWADGRPQDDDITLVVLKVRAHTADPAYPSRGMMSQ